MFLRRTRVGLGVRSFAFIVMGATVTAPAAGEPARAPGSIKVEVAPSPAARPTDRRPGIKGIDALGIIVTPPAHPDARPYNQGGMVIAPRDDSDDNALIPGTDQLGLPYRGRILPPVSKQMADGLQNGIGHALRLLLPDSL